MDRRAVAYLTGPAEPNLPPGVALVATIKSGELAEALGLIEAGDADTLFTPWLGDVADSFSGLVRLLRWLADAGAHLIAQDVGLDTATAGGRRTTAVLIEIDRWERGRRPRGRPGLSAASPNLAERINSMRAQGHSLHAIAETLNREGVPTPRGGSSWRASSVQSVLGYRRPRPPAPGFPPPKPPKPPESPESPKPPPPAGPPKPPHPPKHKRP